MHFLTVRDQKNYLRSEKYPLNDIVFKEFSAKRIVLHRALNMEVIFDQVIEAYWDFKNKHDYWHMRAISSPNDYIFNHEVRSSLNRLAFNLLNLSKLYLDKHCYNKEKNSFVLKVTKSEDLHSQVVAQRKKIYDSNIGYVVGYKLRGSSQHSQLPVSNFSTKNRYNHLSEERSVEFKIKLTYKDLIRIEVPKSLISESTNLELLKVLDDYIYGISQFHQLNRELTSPEISRATNFINALGCDTPAAEKFGDYQCEIVEADGTVCYVGLDWFEVFHFLQRKHSLPVDYTSIKFT